MNTETPSSQSLNPPPMSDVLSKDERNWGAIAHASGAVLSLTTIPGVFAPLIIYFVKKDESAFVADQSKEAINFYITTLIATLAMIPLFFCGIGIIGFIAIVVAAFVLSIIAAIKASNGERYRYPFTLRLLK